MKQRWIRKHASAPVGLCVLCAGGVGGLGGAGCAVQGFNDRAVLGGAERIAALQHSNAESASHDTPTLRTVQRTEWAARRFMVPVDGTVHKPIRRWALTAAGGNERRTGLWPTLESSLWVTEKPRGPIAREGFTAWLEALGELKLLTLEIVRSPGVGKAGRRASPWAMYKRYPETGEWTNVSASNTLESEMEDK